MKEKICYALVDPDGNILADSRNKNRLDCSSQMVRGVKQTVVQVKISENKKASMTARALFHVWCQTLSGYTGEPVNITKQSLKIKFGFPILFADPVGGPILAAILTTLNWNYISWEEKVEVCETRIPVTSIMLPQELKLLMDNIKNWAQHQYNVELDNGKNKS